MEIKANKWLHCGCCGQSFQTWEGYEDQDQDAGFGICKKCQGENRAANDRALDEAVTLLLENLNEKNRAKLAAMTLEEQRFIAWRAMDEGLITFHIGR